jgi:hypothetical protein
MAHQEERRSFWRRVVDAITRRGRHDDVVVTSPPATEEDVRRVEELDKQYGWERFREKP